MESPKADLIAIYRLEFYKKKKNWKLCADSRKNQRVKDSKNKNLLNKTYEVEEAKTELCRLNEAFIDTDFDKSKTTCNLQTSNHAISMNTKDSTNVCQDNFNTLQDRAHEKNLYTVDWMHSDVKLPETVDANEDTVDCLQAVQDYSSVNRYLEGESLCWSDNIEYWKHVSGVDHYWPNVPPQAPNGLDCGDNAVNALTQSTHDWLQKDEPPWLTDDENLRWIYDNVYSHEEVERDCASENSTDSWGEFMRGADVAPHSSEVELSLSKSLSDLDVNANRLAHLSSAQLNAAVWAHTRLLRNLLREESKRQRIRSYLSLTNATLDRPIFSPRAVTEGSSCDDQPTRDCDPSLHYYTAANTLQRERTFTKTIEDIFLAGSYKNEGFGLSGRGRGRLQNVKGSDVQGVVGKGRGRPCRP